MSETCLMLETPDKQKFFTLQSNYKSLVEFVNNFNCELSLVELERGEILDIKELALAIAACRPSKYSKFQIVETKRSRRKRK